MKTVRISNLNHAKLETLLLELMSKQQKRALTMDDAVSELFERAEAKVKP